MWGNTLTTMGWWTCRVGAGAVGRQLLRVTVMGVPEAQQTVPIDAQVICGRANTISRRSVFVVFVSSAAKAVQSRSMVT